MKKNWGRIKKINAYKARPPNKRLQQSRRGLKNDHGYSRPPGEEPTESDQEMAHAAEELETNHDEDMPENDIQNGGSGAAGSGAAMQAMAPLMPQIQNNKIVMTYKHRHCYTFRNVEAGQLTAQRIGPARPQAGTWDPYVKAIETGYYCIPNHVFGFYMNHHESYDLFNTRFTSWKVLNADMCIQGIKVRPNIQIGGTDLRWASTLGYVPDIKTLPSKNRLYPYYELRNYDTVAPGAIDNAEALNPQDMVNKIEQSKNKPQAALGLKMSYLADDNTPDMFRDPASEPFNYKDVEVEPVTNLKGRCVSFNTWKLRHGMISPETYRASNLNKLYRCESGANPAGVIGVLGQNETMFMNMTSKRWNKSMAFGDGMMQKVDIRPFSTQGGQHLHMNRNVYMMSYPVGPLWNNAYDECVIDTNQRLHHNKGGMPFCFGLEDINTVDGKCEDYTITMYIDSHMAIEYDLDHFGGLNGTEDRGLLPNPKYHMQQHVDGVMLHHHNQGLRAIKNFDWSSPTESTFNELWNGDLTLITNDRFCGLQPKNLTGRYQIDGQYVGRGRFVNPSGSQWPIGASEGGHDLEGGFIDVEGLGPPSKYTRSKTKKAVENEEQME